MEGICLVIPPSAFLLDERVIPNLGILKVAAVLEQRDYSVDVLDLSGIENYTDVVADYVRSGRASTFGVTATTPQLPAATKIAEAIKNGQRSAKIILGGPHVTLVNSAARRERLKNRPSRATLAFEQLLETCDVLVAGDGEEAVFDALKLEHGIVDADHPRSLFFLTNEKLESLPFPARHLIDMDSYHYSIDGIRATSLIAQLGCPFECGFCGGRLSPSLRKIRTRESEYIVSEMLHLYDTYGYSGFMFYDDELNVNKKVVDLMRRIRDAQRSIGAEWRLRGFIKSELFTDEQAEAMYEAGFRWILVGFESGSRRILENINKKASREDNTRCMEIARRHGLKVKALMSLGHPGENEGTIAETHDWLLETKPDDFDATVITTYPGTPYYDDAVPHPDKENVWTYTYEKTGDRLHSFDVDFREVAEYYKGAPGEYRSYVYTDHLSSDEIVALRDGLEKDVREKLTIPFNSSHASIRYEHSMGQGLNLFPAHILRTTDAGARS